MEFLNIHFHRNGITGCSFYTGELIDEDVVYVFTQFTDDIAHTAVIRVKDGIPDLEHTLRGDYFADAIKKKIVEVRA